MPFKIRGPVYNGHHSSPFSEVFSLNFLVFAPYLLKTSLLSAIQIKNFLLYTISYFYKEMYAVLAVPDHHNPPALSFLEKQNNNKENKNKTIFEISIFPSVSIVYLKSPIFGKFNIVNFISHLGYHVTKTVM